MNAFSRLLTFSRAKSLRQALYERGCYKLTFFPLFFWGRVICPGNQPGIQVLLWLPLTEGMAKLATFFDNTPTARFQNTSTYR